MPNALLAKKDIHTLLEEATEHEGGLKRALGPVNLVTLGIGAIIGAGIFVLTGQAAASYAGPAIVFSFILAGIACAFAGLCYAEFASLIPVAGSAYTYGYATLGEIIAWIIGWDLILEYAFGAATVASGWSEYFLSLLQEVGLAIPPGITASPGTLMVQFHSRWMAASKLPHGVDPQALPHVVASCNLVAFLAIAAVTVILIIGIQESANFNSFIVIVKVTVVLVFIGLAFRYLMQHGWQPLHENWKVFLPPNQGHFGEYGWSGVFRGAAVVFFAYIGFDAVSTAAQEARNPQKDMPFGIMGSLVICTILYILVAGLLTAVVPYQRLNTAAPIADAVDAMGVPWGSLLVKIGAVAGLGSVMLVLLLGQSRVFYSMANDGLLWEWSGRIHPRFRTPYISSIVVGVFVAFFAALFPINVLGELVSIGTLLAFVIVCAGVWGLRVKHPEMERPFKTPMVPLVPIMGILTAGAMMASLPLATWIRLVVWLILGMGIYFTYGVKHSRVQQQIREKAAA